MKGTVKWFNDKLGYGFITCENGEDVFVHYSQIIAEKGEFRKLRKENTVAFEVAVVEGREQAINVEVK